MSIQDPITLFQDLSLNPAILKAITSCGYDTPTPIQALTIPPILEGRDVLARADTGTGKTAAFILPCLHKLSESTQQQNKPRVLILTPTRELAAQIETAAKTYGKFMRIRIISIVGGMPYRQQLRDLSNPVDIVIATPGRLLDHMQSGKIDLSGIEILVLDEADRMLDMGFIDDVEVIAKKMSSSCQTLLFSATVDNKLNGVIRTLMKDPVRIEIEKEKNKVALIKQELYITDNIQHKMRLLQHFLDNGNVFKGIIFSATKIHCDNLANQLEDQGYSAAALHGDLKQNVRNRTIERLRRGKLQFLVATDVAARGIDISDVTHVFNFDLPKFAEDYVHRIGRTGRAGKTGTAISFALPSDARHLQKIERYIGQHIFVEVIPGLEPTKRMGSTKGPDDSKSKRYGNKGGGSRFSDNAKGGKRFGKSYDEPRGSSRFERSSEKPAGKRFEKSYDEPQGKRGEISFADRKRPAAKSYDAPRGESRFGKSSDRPAGRRPEGGFEDRKRPARSFDEPRGESRFGKSSDRPAGRRPEGGFEDRKRPARSFDEPRGESRFGKSSERPAPRRSEGGFEDRKRPARSFDEPRGESRFGKSSERPAPRRSEGGFEDRKRPARSFDEPRGGSRFGKPSDKPAGRRSEGGFEDRKRPARSFDSPQGSSRFGKSSDKPAGRRSEGGFEDRKRPAKSFGESRGPRFGSSSDKPAGRRSEGGFEDRKRPTKSFDEPRSPTKKKFIVNAAATKSKKSGETLSRRKSD